MIDEMKEERIRNISEFSGRAKTKNAVRTAYGQFGKSGPKILLNVKLSYHK